MRYDETKIQRFFITCMAFFPYCECEYSDWTCYGTLMHVPTVKLVDRDKTVLGTADMIINDSVDSERYVLTIRNRVEYVKDITGVIKALKELKRSRR